MERMYAAYVRSYNLNSETDCLVQMSLIQQYCDTNNISSYIVYRDDYYMSRKSYGHSTADLIGLKVKEHENACPVWENLMESILKEKVNSVLVDTRYRLFRNDRERRCLERLLSEHHVNIIEVGGYEPDNGSSGNRVVIYDLFSPRNEKHVKRSANLLSDLNKLYSIAESHSWTPTGLYIDTHEFHHNEYRKVKALENIDIFLVKYLYHINRKTGAFIKELQDFKKRGIRVLSAEEGEADLIESPQEWFDKPKRVAVYDCHEYNQEYNGSLKADSSGKPDYYDSAPIPVPLFKQRVEAFIKLRTTGWQVTSFYCDQQSDRRIELENLVSNSSSYDLIMVDSLSKISESFNFVSSFLLRTKKPIFSLQEGGFLLHDIK